VATQLMIDVCGATVRSGTVDIGGDGPPGATIRLRDARVAGLLGIEVPRSRSAEVLRALEFATEDAPDGLDVTVPPFRRADVTREADVIEEVARLDALQKLPATLPSRHGAAGRLLPRQQQRRLATDALAAQGLSEIVGWSFVSPELAGRLRLSDQPALELENPMSADQSHLRTSLLGSLLDAARSNRARGVWSLHLFEAGAVYLPEAAGELPREPYHVGALLAGPVRPPTWRTPDPGAADFFGAKGVLTGLLGRLRADWSLEPAEEPFLHPGRSARILVSGEPVGWIGELHPLVTETWDLEGTIGVFELDLDAVPGAPTALYEDLTTFPEVREDLAVVVPDHVSAAQVLDTVRRAGEPLLSHADVFDVYRNPELLGEGNVSLALRLTYRAADRTLTDEDVAGRREMITAALESELRGRVRAS
jgi:phenylalanyl-tRNA synthetase beta chain